jgi:DNA primase
MDGKTLSRLDEKARVISITEVVREYIPLTDTGRAAFGVCPFHKDTARAFAVCETQGIYHCFTCMRTGDALDFLMEFQKIEYEDAVTLLLLKVDDSRPLL